MMTLMADSKVRCPVCGWPFRVTVDGVLENHNRITPVPGGVNPNDYKLVTCPGSGKDPTELIGAGAGL